MTTPDDQKRQLRELIELIDRYRAVWDDIFERHREALHAMLSVPRGPQPRKPDNQTTH
jgi:hypothetical protein